MTFAAVVSWLGFHVTFVLMCHQSIMDVSSPQLEQELEGRSDHDLIDIILSLAAENSALKADKEQWEKLQPQLEREADRLDQANSRQIVNRLEHLETIDAIDRKLCQHWEKQILKILGGESNFLLQTFDSRQTANCKIELHRLEQDIDDSIETAKKYAAAAGPDLPSFTLNTRTIGGVMKSYVAMIKERNECYLRTR